MIKIDKCNQKPLYCVGYEEKMPWHAAVSMELIPVYSDNGKWETSPHKETAHYTKSVGFEVLTMKYETREAKQIWCNYIKGLLMTWLC